jgi:pimeloyl-ACP methyl ester carboxylesterase
LSTTENSRSLANVFAVLAVVCGFCGHAHAGEYVHVSPNLDIYYEEAGSGTPIIFIPGWLGTTEFFNAQISYFSASYRAISYDPRSQGRSSKTLSGNDHMQHGADLKAFLNALSLVDIIIAGHSSGCSDSYAYFRAYGTDNVKAFICIDQTPKEIVAYEGDWAFTQSPLDYRRLYDGLTNDRVSTTREFFQSMVTRPLTEKEVDWFVGETMKTPTYVAKQLLLEWFILDWTDEVIEVAGEIPVLNVLAESRVETGKAWLAKNAPNSEVAEFDLHMMFWEFPEKFNAVVDEFLAAVE